MRRHGWELPYHPFQVTAIAVFLALVFAFYIFFLPFVESNILKIFVIAAYSSMVMVVFVLYIWCVATDPADVRVLSSKNHDLSLPSFKNKVDPSVASSRNQAEPQAKRHSDTSSNLGSLPAIDCCLDRICMQKSNAEDSLSEDGMHYCSFYDVEVLKYSKHCWVCDKCVDGFDHHCRWLNNCIGRRNYKGFVVLMVSGVFMFILQWSFGLCILVHRFLNGRHFESMIALKLGKSFSSMAYLFVVVLCTILAMAATYLLGQLTCFHAFLMKKGITTYDCAIAKREQEAKSESELPPNFLALPASFLPTPCGEASSARAQQEQDGQISPSLLFDHEVQGSHHPRSSILKQATDRGVGSWKAFSERFSKRKTSMKINPWNLASLNKQDIVQAVTTSRSRTSTVQPVAHFSKSLVIAQVDSSFHSSRSFRADFIASFGIGSVSRKYSEINLNLLNQSILSTWQNGKLPLDSFEQIDSSENDSGSLSYQAERDDMLIPLQREARNVFKSSHAFSAGGVSLLAAAASSSPISEHACADTFHASTNGYT